jgi:hypothetical protein
MAVTPKGLPPDDPSGGYLLSLFSNSITVVSIVMKTNKSLQVM